MNKKIKKIMACLIATASFTTGVVGVNVSAAEFDTPIESEIINEYAGPTAYVQFGNGATAGIYRDSSKIIISTSYNSGSLVRVKLESTSGSVASGDDKDKWGYDGYISGNYSGNGFTSCSSYHEGAGGSIGLSR